MHRGGAGAGLAKARLTPGDNCDARVKTKRVNSNFIIALSPCPYNRSKGVSAEKALKAGIMELGYRIYTHDKFTEQSQHWHAGSESFAAASQLISLIRAGWALESPHVRLRQVDSGRSRPRAIYDFRLIRGRERLIVPVLSNPFIERYLIQQDIRIVHEDEPLALALPE